MDYSEDFTQSELIYLFIDGEATLEQRNTLFAALNRDTELADEFQDALKMRESTFVGVHSAVPPQAVTDNLFAKAGFATAISAAAISASSTSTFGTFTQGVSGFIAKNIAASLLISSLVGAVGCFALTKVLSGYDETERTPTYSAKVVPAPAQPLTASQLAITEDPISKLSNADIVPRVVYVPNNDGLAKVNKAEEVQVTKQETVQETVQAVAPEPSRIIYLPNTLADANGTHKIPEITIIHSLPEPILGDDEFVPTFLIETDLLKGMTLYPSRDFSNSGGYVQNAKLSAMIRLSENSYAGIEAGNEDFPIFVKSSDGQFRMNNSLFSIGGKYEYYFNQLIVFDKLMPYSSGFAGWSKSGLVLKAGAGLVWMPDRRVSLKLGCENMSLIHEYKSTTKHAGKLGIVYGVAVSF